MVGECYQATPNIHAFKPIDSTIHQFGWWNNKEEHDGLDFVFSLSLMKPKEPVTFMLELL